MTTVTSVAERERTGRRPSGRESWGAFVYLVPALVVFVAFFFVPLALLVLPLLFQRSDLFGRPSGFVGYTTATSSPTRASARCCW